MALTADQAARAIVLAKNAKAEAEKAYRQAEVELREAFEKAGVTFTVVDGAKVNLIESIRSTFDTEKLAQLVSPKIFKQVTVAKIDSDLFKSAVKIGVIKQDIADSVTEVKPVMSVKVTEVSVKSVMNAIFETDQKGEVA